SGEICFRGLEGKVAYLYALHLASGQAHKLIPDPTLESAMVSPDGNWIVAATPAPDAESPNMVKAYPKDGGTPLPICRRCFMKWTRDQKFIIFSLNTGVFTFTPGSSMSSA